MSEPGPLIKPNSYKDIKDSIYFREKMVKKKTTKKLTQKEKDDLQAGKQQRDLIPATPLRKSGRGNAAAQKEVDDTVEAGRKKLNRKNMPATEVSRNRTATDQEQWPSGKLGATRSRPNC